MSARVLAALAAVVVLAGCSSGDGNKSASPTLPDKPSSSASTSAARTNQVGAELNSRGNVAKELGEDAFLKDPAGQDQVLTFAVDSVTADIPCTSGFDEPPVSGHYLGVAVRASTSPAYPADQYFLTFQPTDFKVIGPDGVTVSALGGNAYSCLPQQEMFTLDLLAPGQQYTGTVVLDSPVTSGSLIYAPQGGGGSTGWEWQF